MATSMMDGNNSKNFDVEKTWIFIKQLKRVKYNIVDYITICQHVAIINSIKFVQLYNY